MGFRKRAIGVTMVMIGCPSAPLMAQGAVDGGGDIIVTATKRSDTLQNVPLSISAIGAASLEQRSASTFIDYAASIPNLGFGYTGDGSFSARTISLRGISGDNTTGFYLDETPVIDSIDPKIVDVDRVEVLRGPQGTLYGARSMGGTVRMITKQPQLGETAGRIHASLGTTRHTDRPNYAADGAINLPLGDKAALRASAFYQYDAGFFERQFAQGSNGAPGRHDNIGRTKSWGGALSVRLEPTDRLSITPRLLYQKSVANGFPYADATPADLNPRDLVQRRPFDIAEGGSDRWYLASLDAHYDLGSASLISSTSYFNRRVYETEDQTGVISAFFLDPFGAAPLPAAIDQGVPFKRFVQEIRLVSSDEGALSYVLGGYYSWTRDGEYYPPVPTAGLDAATGGALGSDLFFSDAYRNTVREPAVFGEATYKLGHGLSATAGLRWYRITTTNLGFQDGLAAGGRIEDLADAATGGVFPTGRPFRLRQSGVNPKAQLSWKLTPDDMIYATAARGFRPGGVSPAVPPSPALGCAADLAALGTSLSAAKFYKADSLWSYELGAKTSWFGRKLVVNGAAFYIDWKNIQQQILPPCGYQFRANAGAARSKGFEIELQARPLPGLELDAALGYIDARISKAGSISALRKGDRVLQVPDWTSSVSLTYTTAIGDDAHLSTRIGYSYVGESFSANNDPFNPRRRAPYELWDARLAVTWSRYELALFGKNLGDRRANLADNRSISVETPGRARVVVNQPRTIGIEMRSSF
ncbi:TonB-dependent receptor [Rhizorhabdus wittichii]|uniref:TonB-dependent receptor n=1 Tax=Rhizorhabdus wittichii TaxID=160791 RepID=A0A975D2C3_9SPHN|nr:TonB-dependent receptor [Rhizorhabdus wittichii]QTH21531.1 TonB-dependent receptor [Rhizorhabdus wittichii]